MRGPLRPPGIQRQTVPAYGNLPPYLPRPRTGTREFEFVNERASRGAERADVWVGLGWVWGFGWLDWTGLDAAFALRMVMVRVYEMEWHDMARDMGTGPELNIS